MGKDSFMFNMDNIESFIKNNEVLYKQLTTKSIISDIKLNSILKCTYLEGLYRAIKIEKTRIIVQLLSDAEELYEVSPEFVKEVKVDQKIIKALYGNKSRGLFNNKG